MVDIKGTRTERNLLASFAGESQASSRYTHFAKAVQRDGQLKIADILEKIAAQEKDHAARFFRLLGRSDLKTTVSFPVGRIGSTAENIRAAVRGERAENSQIYPRFAAIAREEGFPVIAALWNAVSLEEKRHERRYNDLLSRMAGSPLFCRRR